MAVVIDIQSLLPRIAAVGSALDVLASVTDASERVAEGARVKRLGVPQLEIEATYHYAKGFVQALAHVELCSTTEAERLSKQVGQ
ncbi:Unknown protein sequence [Pseudomonas caricapapayae]|uniref:Uncharacterized protein n=1 Tax=Pseudomonas caricapapayae TaxID=46678 RepID=A0A0P9LPA9_9PSED|nr:hypothetical protein [Pseudomonas caricapapayae]KAA8689634.1 hypothetical protein F4W67_27160 [Pseudomonas caricapapayae]KPW56403.1 Unknown protein sequence [Pseudomonas caricapapayae]RMM09542.1 hypothetical protein ALQ84_00883 [Pseudomonas caricapapayae]